MRWAGLLLAFTVFWGGLNSLAQDADDIRQTQANAASTSAGKTLFQQNCGFCHGPDARGASGPDLIRSAVVSHDANGNLIGPVVRNGRPEKGMPAFPFSDAQILQIADFLHAEAKLASSVASRVPTEYPLEKLLVGNANAGKSFFSGNCARCHSPTGDLAHIASKYKPIDLQITYSVSVGNRSQRYRYRCIRQKVYGRPDLRRRIHYFFARPEWLDSDLQSKEGQRGDPGSVSGAREAVDRVYGQKHP